MGKRINRTVIVTGASSGIGEVTVLHLAKLGYVVAATSRNISRLEELLAKSRADSLQISGYELDINDSSSVEATVPLMLDQMGSVDALVNNAGYGLWGCLEDLTETEVMEQFQTNVFAVLRMSQAVLPSMRERGSGTIVNVGSVSGRIGSPGGGAYSSTKFALDGLSRVLRMEVAQFGVRVALIEPGLFRTNFHRNLNMGSRVLDERSPYYNFTQKIRGRSAGEQRSAGNPMTVAKTIAKVIAARHPKPRYQVGIDARLGAMASRFVPDGLLEFFVNKVMVR